MNDRHRHIEKIKELIAIESTAQNLAGLKAAHDFMVDLVRASGKDITIEEFESGGLPSFLAYKGKKRPEKFHLILNGHLDVIPAKSEQFKPFVKDGKLYGRGAYDMKAACVIMADVFCEFVDKVPFALGLQIVTDEEPGGYHGTRYQVHDCGVRSEYVICGECGRSTTRHEIGSETKGVLFANVELLGKTAHGAYPWHGESAAVRAVHFVNALQKIYPTPKKEHNGSTATITGITSVGGAHNQLPEHALVKIDCRYTAADSHFNSKENFTTFIKSICPDAIVTFAEYAAPMYSDPNSPFIQSLKRAAEQIENHAFSFALRHGGCDGRHYAPVGGQACEFGIPGEHKHAEGEYITLKAAENYYRTLRLFLDSEARRMAPKRTSNKHLAPIAVS